MLGARSKATRSRRAIEVGRHLPSNKMTAAFMRGATDVFADRRSGKLMIDAESPSYRESWTRPEGCEIGQSGAARHSRSRTASRRTSNGRPFRAPTDPRKASSSNGEFTFRKPKT